MSFIQKLLWTSWTGGFVFLWTLLVFYLAESVCFWKSNCLLVRKKSFIRIFKTGLMLFGCLLDWVVPFSWLFVLWFHSRKIAENKKIKIWINKLVILTKLENFYQFFVLFFAFKLSVLINNKQLHKCKIGKRFACLFNYLRLFYNQYF